MAARSAHDAFGTPQGRKQHSGPASAQPTRTMSAVATDDSSRHIHLIVPYTQQFIKWAQMVQRSLTSTTNPHQTGDLMVIHVLLDPASISTGAGQRSDCWPVDTQLDAHFSIQSPYSHNGDHFQIARYPVYIVLAPDDLIPRTQLSLPIVFPLTWWYVMLQHFAAPLRGNVVASIPTAGTESTTGTQANGGTRFGTNAQSSSPEINDKDFLYWRWLRRPSPSGMNAHILVGATAQVFSRSTSEFTNTRQDRPVRWETLSIDCIDAYSADDHLRTYEAPSFFTDATTDPYAAVDHPTNLLCWSAQVDVAQSTLVITVPTRALRRALGRMKQLLHPQGAKGDARHGGANARNDGGGAGRDASDRGQEGMGNTRIELLFRATVRDEAQPAPWGPSNPAHRAVRTDSNAALHVDLCLHMDASNFASNGATSSMHIVEHLDTPSIPIHVLVHAWQRGVHPSSGASLSRQDIVRRLDALQAERRTALINFIPFYHLIEGDESESVTIVVNDESPQAMIFGLHQQYPLHPAGRHRDDTATSSMHSLGGSTTAPRLLMADIRTIFSEVPYSSHDGTETLQPLYEKRMVQVASYGLDRRSGDNGKVGPSSFSIDARGQLHRTRPSLPSTLMQDDDTADMDGGMAVDAAATTIDSTDTLSQTDANDWTE